MLTKNNTVGNGTEENIVWPLDHVQQDSNRVRDQTRYAPEPTKY